MLAELIISRVSFAYCTLKKTHPFAAVFSQPLEIEQMLAVLLICARVFYCMRFSGTLSIISAYQEVGETYCTNKKNAEDMACVIPSPTRVFSFRL